MGGVVVNHSGRDHNSDHRVSSGRNDPYTNIPRTVSKVGYYQTCRHRQLSNGIGSLTVFVSVGSKLQFVLLINNTATPRTALPKPKATGEETNRFVADAIPMPR